MDTADSAADGDAGAATVVPATETPDTQPPAPDDATLQGSPSLDGGSGPDAQTSPTAAAAALLVATESADDSGASPDASATAAGIQTIATPGDAQDTPTETPLSDGSAGPDASATAAAQTTATSDDATALATPTSDGSVPPSVNARSR